MAVDKVKDPAEIFEEDRSVLARVLEAAKGTVEEHACESALANSVREMERSGAANTHGVVDAICNMSDTANLVPTGIKTLDGYIDGGLTPGITVVAAASSAGKTTLVVNQMLNMARQGYAVMLVSLEMGAREIVAKMISRLMYEDSGVKKASIKLYLPDCRKHFTQDENDALAAAAKRISDEVADRIIVVEPSGQPTGGDVVKLAKDALQIAWAKNLKGLVVFVDYLQILGRENERMDDRQAVDTNLIRLRQASRDLKIPFVIVSSINRASYGKGEIVMEAFKESGSIEYSADLALGLYPADINVEATNLKSKKEYRDLPKDELRRIAIENLKRRPVRELELSVLKNRNGALPCVPVRLDFIPGASTFIDADGNPAGHNAAMAMKDAYLANNEDDDNAEESFDGEPSEDGDDSCGYDDFDEFYNQ